MSDNSIRKEYKIEEQIASEEEKVEAIAHKDSAIKRLDISFNKHIELREYKKSNLLAYWIKDFAKYHDEEKNFTPKSLKNFKRGDIVKVNLGFNIGNEFGGLHYCIVINNNDNINSGHLNVIPLSSAKENKDYNSITCVDLGDELYTLLTKKYNTEMIATLERFRELKEIKDLASDEINKLSKKISLLKKLDIELEKMKHGSVAYVHQITTISKQRIFKTPILSGIRISSKNLDLIDDKINKLFTKNY